MQEIHAWIKNKKKVKKENSNSQTPEKLAS